jgi:hypothetical protein
MNPGSSGRRVGSPPMNGTFRTPQAAAGSMMRIQSLRVIGPRRAGWGLAVDMDAQPLDASRLHHWPGERSVLDLVAVSGHLSLSGRGREWEQACGQT